MRGTAGLPRGAGRAASVECGAAACRGASPPLAQALTAVPRPAQAGHLLWVWHHPEHSLHPHDAAGGGLPLQRLPARVLDGVVRGVGLPVCGLRHPGHAGAARAPATGAGCHAHACVAAADVPFLRSGGAGRGGSCAPCALAAQHSPCLEPYPSASPSHSTLCHCHSAEHTRPAFPPHTHHHTTITRTRPPASRS